MHRRQVTNLAVDKLGLLLEMSSRVAVIKVMQIKSWMSLLGPVSSEPSIIDLNSGIFFLKNSLLEGASLLENLLNT